MPNVNQIYSFVNIVAQQALGKTAVVVTDTSTLVALGDMVLSSDKNTEAFKNVLVDRIGRTVFAIRAYEPEFPDIVKDSFEYGSILQKIYVGMPEAKENNSWNIGKENYTAVFAPVNAPKYSQKLFDSVSTFEIAISIPDAILKTAFLNAVQMATFISSIFVAVENRMKLSIENTSDMVRASFIARKLKSTKPLSSINLLNEYNTATNESLTVTSALRSLEFLKWATMQINLWVNRMRRMSTLFNEDGFERHTPTSELAVVMLDQFVAAAGYYLQADTFHEELVKLPMFVSVPYWQGSGIDYSFDSTSSIKIKLDEETTVEESGVIGVIYDREALGVTINDPRTTTERNNHDEYTNYYNKFNKGFFNDMSENGMVFYMKEV